MSIAVRFAERREVVPPLLSAYVDDIYGGNPYNVSYDLARDLRSYICSMGSKFIFVRVLTDFFATVVAMCMH